MASAAFTDSTSSALEWTISGLQYQWNTTNYIKAVIYNGPKIPTGGTSETPTGIVDTENAPGSGSDYSFSEWWTGLDPDHYYAVHTAVQTSDTTWWALNDIWDWTDPAPPDPRPSNWSWTTSIYAGAPMTVTTDRKIQVMPASEWNAFTSRINEFRNYKGLSNYSFTTVSSGGTFWYWIFNQARTAINDMSPPTSVPPTESSGSDVDAYGFNRLKDSLNSIA